ncbi:MAG TPA: ATP-binding protein [Candidatus Saccharimonadales bacterium]|nr:ATP-binding protein [Candidatus Saccharimonadales bacterium]
MSQLFINIIGHNSSGKTTLAKKLAAEFGLNRVSGDDFRNFVGRHVAYFQNTDWSHPNEHTQQLNPLVINYRLELSWILLRARAHVLIDGSGSTKAIRATYMDRVTAEFPEVTRVIIWADVAEAELRARLEQRGGQWVKQYEEIRRPSFEPPEQSEAEVVLRYTQDNYIELAAKLHDLLNT